MGGRSSKAVSNTARTVVAQQQQPQRHAGAAESVLLPVEAAVEASTVATTTANPLNQMPNLAAKWNESEGKYDINPDVLREIEKWSTERIAEKKKAVVASSPQSQSITLNRLESDALLDMQLEKKEVLVGRFSDIQLKDMLTDLRDGKKSVDEFSVQYGISVVTVTNLIKYVRVPVVTPDPDTKGGFLAS